jgi:hypothetical protein
VVSGAGGDARQSWCLMVTVITKTIGSDRDFPDFTAAEAAVPTIVGGTDLVAADTAVVFEADAGTYTEDVTFSGGLTTDATRNVTYKPAAGSEHGGDSSAGVIIQGTYPVTVQNENYTVFNGLNLKGTYGFFNFVNAGGTVCRNLILTATGNYAVLSQPLTSIPVAPITIENCVVISAAFAALDIRPPSIAGTADYKVRNCTLLDSPRAIRVGQNGIAGSVMNIDAVNNLSLVSGSAWVTAGGGTINVSGSNNFGGSTDPFPVALQGSLYPITASTSYDPGAGDYALYVASNGALLDSPNNDVIGQGLSKNQQPRCVRDPAGADRRYEDDWVRQGLPGLHGSRGLCGNHCYPRVRVHRSCGEQWSHRV